MIKIKYNMYVDTNQTTPSENWQSKTSLGQIELRIPETELTAGDVIRILGSTSGTTLFTQGAANDIGIRLLWNIAPGDMLGATVLYAEMPTYVGPSTKSVTTMMAQLFPKRVDMSSVMSYMTSDTQDNFYLVNPTSGAFWTSPAQHRRGRYVYDFFFNGWVSYNAGMTDNITGPFAIATQTDAFSNSCYGDEYGNNRSGYYANQYFSMGGYPVKTSNSYVWLNFECAIANSGALSDGSMRVRAYEFRWRYRSDLFAGAEEVEKNIYWNGHWYSGMYAEGTMAKTAYLKGHGTVWTHI